MQVNKVDYSNSFKANTGKGLKIIRGHLNDDTTAIVRFTMDKNKDIKTLEGYVLDKGHVIEGKGMGNSKGLQEKDIFPFLENLQEHAKKGVDFFKEFTKAMIS